MSINKKEDENNENESQYNESSYRYEGQLLIYTDSISGLEYILNDSKTDWIPRIPSSYQFDGSTYIHTDEGGQKFKWNSEKKEWTLFSSSKDSPRESEESEYESEDENDKEKLERKKYKKRNPAPGWNMNSNCNLEYGDKQTITDPKDNSLYEWNNDKKAWFPKIDDDFMAVYQLNYGFTADGKAEPTQPTINKTNSSHSLIPPKSTKIEKPEKESWYNEEPDKTTKVYVSGLPETINDESFIALMSKYGIISTDVRRDNKPRIKIYKDSRGVPKGDALCTYAKVESVQLAVQMLDESLYEDGTSIIRVERARFQMKGETYNPKLKPQKLKKKEIEQIKKQKEKYLSWELDAIRGTTPRAKHDKVIIIYNLFKPSDFDDKPELILQLKNRLMGHCQKFGTVRKIEIYDHHIDGIAQVFFSRPSQADLAIENLNGRLFDGKVMKVFTWDGKSKYKINETAEEEEARLNKWLTFLEDETESQEQSK